MSSTVYAQRIMIIMLSADGKRGFVRASSQVSRREVRRNEKRTISSALESSFLTRGFLICSPTLKCKSSK